MLFHLYTVHISIPYCTVMNKECLPIYILNFWAFSNYGKWPVVIVTKKSTFISNDNVVSFIYLSLFMKKWRRYKYPYLWCMLYIKQLGSASCSSSNKYCLTTNRKKKNYMDLLLTLHVSVLSPPAQMKLLCKLNFCPPSFVTWRNWFWQEL